MRLLEGTRVLSLEQYIAGPYCTSLLADAGAEVIKVEQPGIGDPRRHYEPRTPDHEPDINAGYVPYNRGKKSIELDVRSPGGLAAFEELLGTADVLVCNLRPNFLQSAGLDPVRLRNRYPRLIVCEITGFGATPGPQREWPAFDSVIQASAGLSGLLGDDPNGAPLLAPMSTMDMLAGLYAALGILMALQGRERSGEGVHVDTSMHDVGAAFLMRPLTLFEFTGVAPTRGSDAHSPVGAFLAGDGRWVSIVIPTQQMWERTCTVIGRDDLLSDPELLTNEARAAAMRTRIIPALEEWADSMDADAAARALRDAGQPAGVVSTIEQVRHDPRLASRGLFVDVGEGKEEIRVPRLPILFDGQGADVVSIAGLGHHTEEILRGSTPRR
ncbi:CoA transferase [Microbacterium sp. LMI12-1-1.1]|uniref:CaiB/BaiF CoA transferase family protein n=1 Tax=Microbacterium sp. LMI12-1-1.1 TaxID=3135225 RepID=UPI00342C85F3